MWSKKILKIKSIPEPLDKTLIQVVKCDSNLGEKLECRIEFKELNSKTEGSLTHILKFEGTLIVRKSAEFLASRELIAAHDNFGFFLIDDESEMKKSILKNQSSFPIELTNAIHVIVVGVTEVFDVVCTGNVSLDEVLINLVSCRKNNPNDPEQMQVAK